MGVLVLFVVVRVFTAVNGCTAMNACSAVNLFTAGQSLYIVSECLRVMVGQLTCQTCFCVFQVYSTFAASYNVCIAGNLVAYSPSNIYCF